MASTQFFALCMLIVAWNFDTSDAYTSHHACREPNTTGLSNHPADDIRVAQCQACYMETLMALTKEQGMDMVLGANDGISYDPAWYFGYWKAVPHHKIVWVEPIPDLFRKLTNNTKHIENKLLLNLAVRPDSMTQTELDFVCWDMGLMDQVLDHGAPDPIPASAGSGIKTYWRALCSSSVNALNEASDLYRGPKFNQLPEEEKASVKATVQQYQVQYRVPALKTGEILDKYNLKDIQYLQIDVEGLDNEIIKSLPLGVDGFYPKMILYENHQGFEVKQYLESHGYFVCCCLRHLGSNIVAVYAGNN
eukprot:m.133223 g.133223  ORF g.133223 m.133223 type:complete len:306 (+) comp29663_c0_seq1:110-1027(+)